jgi:hypothetical protein
MLTGSGTPTAGNGEAGDYWLDESAGNLYGPAVGTPTTWPTIPVATYQTEAGPASFGYIGWTGDPADCSAYNAPPVGNVYLIRFRAAKTGTASHLEYATNNGGTTLTTGNILGIYDSGQTTAGQATLLGQTADLTTTWSTGAQTPFTALQSTVSLLAGQDYFVALLSNGTTAPGFLRRGGSNLFAVNSQLSGLSGRILKGAAGVTSLPATIASASLSIDTTSFMWTFVIK